ncbi:FtsB family cell division protein [Dissulfurispira sp.]|uniref:FtsB family cell division protein n=1 Tax=Dissulfurispira sp. TaxID=2817609 RepID=UPI002FD9E655
MRGRIQPRNLRQQVTVERKKRNVIFFTVIILALLYTSTSLLLGNMGFIKYLTLKKTKNSLETEITILEKENKILQAQINALKEDPYYIEKHAREEFGLAKPDEYIFQFQDDAKKN